MTFELKSTTPSGCADVLDPWTLFISTALSLLHAQTQV